MVRVLRTIESFYPVMSGPANQAFRISSELEKKGLSSPILTSDIGPAGLKSKEKMQNVAVHRFPIKWKFMKYFYTPSMRNAFKNFDLVHAHSYRSYQTEIAYKMCRRLKKGFVLQNHGSVLGYTSFVRGVMQLPYKAYDLFNKEIVLDADCVIANTKQEALELRRFGVSKRQIVVNPYGIDITKYTPGKKAGAPTLLWVGRITKDRNIEQVIKALKIVKGQVPNVQLKIVGNEFKRTDTQKTGEIERLKLIAKRSGVSDRVKFIPWTEERAIQEFKRADVFVYTSLWENFGQTILEAGASELPLICTKVGVATDLVNKNTGSFVTPDDEEALAAEIVKFTDSRRQKLAAKTLKGIIEKGFSWKQIIEKYINVYRDVRDRG